MPSRSASQSAISPQHICQQHPSATAQISPDPADDSEPSSSRVIRIAARQSREPAPPTQQVGQSQPPSPQPSPTLIEDCSTALSAAQSVQSSVSPQPSRRIKRNTSSLQRHSRLPSTTRLQPMQSEDSHVAPLCQQRSNSRRTTLSRNGRATDVSSTHLSPTAEAQSPSGTDSTLQNYSPNNQIASSINNPSTTAGSLSYRNESQSMMLNVESVTTKRNGMHSLRNRDTKVNAMVSTTQPVAPFVQQSTPSRSDMRPLMQPTTPSTMQSQLASVTHASVLGSQRRLSWTDAANEMERQRQQSLVRKKNSLEQHHIKQLAPQHHNPPHSFNNGTTTFTPVSPLSPSSHTTSSVTSTLSPSHTVTVDLSSHIQRIPAPRVVGVTAGKDILYPVFKADGEVEGNYIFKKQFQRRRFIAQATLVFAAVYSLMELVYGITPAYSIQRNWAALLIRLIGAGVCLLYAQALRSKVFQEQSLLESSASAVMGLAAILLMVAETQRDQADLVYSTRDALVLSLVLIQAQTHVVLRIKFRYCAMQSAILCICYNCLMILTQTQDDTYIILSNLYQLLIVGGLLLVCYDSEKYRDEDFNNKRQLFQERRKAEQLMRSMLPAQILGEYLDGRMAQLSSTATIGYCEIKLMPNTQYKPRPNTVKARVSMGPNAANGLTGTVLQQAAAVTATNEMLKPQNVVSPAELMQKLHDTFKRIDSIVNMYSIRGVNKIETVSKTYLLCAGLLQDVDDHGSAMIEVALEIMDMIKRSTRAGQRLPISLRIGISTGHVVGGIIGEQRRYFRVFGDTVNVAARMCMNAGQGQIQLSAATYHSMTDPQRHSIKAKFSAPRELQIKGKGAMQTYTVDMRDDFVPQFGKAVQFRGNANDKIQDQPLLNKSFVYHQIIEQTTLHPLTLRYQTPRDIVSSTGRVTHATDIEAGFQRQNQVQIMSSLQFVNALWAVWMIAYSIFVGVRHFHNDGTVSDTAVIPLITVMATFFTAQAVIILLKLWAQRIQYIMLCTVTGLCFWVILSLGFWGLQGAIQPIYSMYALCIYACLLLRLQSRYAVPVISTTCLAFIITLIARRDSWYDIVLCLLFLAICMATSFITQSRSEQRIRFNFLLKYALDQESIHMDSFLSNLLPTFVVDVLRKKNGRPMLQVASQNALEAEFTSDNKHGLAHPSDQLSSRFAMKFKCCTVFESDIVGYTKMVADWAPDKTLNMLNSVFCIFDDCAAQCQVEKIETIGDAFMCVVFDGEPDPVLNFAIQIKQRLHIRNLQSTDANVQIRMGISTGNCYGGVIGSKIPRFHLFGDAHDQAILLEQNGKIDDAIVSSTTYQMAKTRYQFDVQCYTPAASSASANGKKRDEIQYILVKQLEHSEVTTTQYEAPTFDAPSIHEKSIVPEASFSGVQPSVTSNGVHG